MAKLFSIIIPTYNYAQFIGRAIESVARQTQSTWEIVVVDDGSTDGTEAIVGQYAARDGRVRYVRQENSGVSSARNRGARDSKGEYLIFLDADDELLPDAVTVFADAFANHPAAGAILAAHESVSKAGAVRFRPLAPLSGNRRENFSGFLNKKFDVATGAVAVKRQVAEQILFPTSIRNNEDVVFLAQVLALYECVSVSKPLLRVHHHQSSLRSSMAALRASPVEQIVEALFAPAILPSTYFCYRDAFFSRLCLSRFRSYYLRGEYADACAHYNMAVRIRPSSVFRFSYLSKYLRLKMLR